MEHFDETKLPEEYEDDKHLDYYMHWGNSAFKMKQNDDPPTEMGCYIVSKDRTNDKEGYCGSAIVHNIDEEDLKQFHTPAVVKDGVWIEEGKWIKKKHT
jgi:hypothetical protein